MDVSMYVYACMYSLTLSTEKMWKKHNFQNNEHVWGWVLALNTILQKKE